jgi:hypothetical protein
MGDDEAGATEALKVDDVRPNLPHCRNLLGYKDRRGESDRITQH